MSFDQLKQAILEEADKRAEAIADDFYTRLGNEESRITDKARTMEEEIIEQGAIKAKDAARRLHQDASLQMRARVLSAKQSELDLTQEEFKQEILSADADKTETLLTGLIKLLPHEKGTVTAGANHAEQLKKILRNPEIVLDKATIPNEGGFVYRNDKMELDLTVGYLVKNLFTKYRTSIAKALFD